MYSSVPMPFRACFVTRKNAAHEARFRTAGGSRPSSDAAAPARQHDTPPHEDRCSVEHTTPDATLPPELDATGNTMTGEHDDRDVRDRGHPHRCEVERDVEAEAHAAQPRALDHVPREAPLRHEQRCSEQRAAHPQSVEAHDEARRTDRLAEDSAESPARRGRQDGNYPETGTRFVHLRRRARTRSPRRPACGDRCPRRCAAPRPATARRDRAAARCRG